MTLLDALRESIQLSGTKKGCDHVASAQPGVLAVLTADNAPRLPDRGRVAANPPSGRFLSLLQDREVRYNGEPIAIVIADTFEQATHAAALVRIIYRTETPAVDRNRRHIDAAFAEARRAWH